MITAFPSLFHFPVTLWWYLPNKPLYKPQILALTIVSREPKLRRMNKAHLLTKKQTNKASLILSLHSLFQSSSGDSPSIHKALSQHSAYHSLATLPLSLNCRVLRMLIVSLCLKDPNKSLLNGFPVSFAILVQRKCLSWGYFTKMPGKRDKVNEFGEYSGRETILKTFPQ